MFSFAQSVQPQAQVNTMTALTLERLTRVSDLPTDAQGHIHQLSQHVAEQISIAEQLSLSSEQYADSIDSVQTDISELNKRIKNNAMNLQNDQGQVEALGDHIKTDLDNVNISVRFVDRLRAGNFSSVRGSNDHFLNLFFNTAQAYQKKINSFEILTENLENHAVEVQRSSQTIDADSLPGVIRDYHDALIHVTAKIASTHDMKIQTLGR